MTEFFFFFIITNVTTSSRYKAYFRDLKHSDLRSNYEPMRSDKFVMRHIESIKNILKLERAVINLLLINDIKYKKIFTCKKNVF